MSEERMTELVQAALTESGINDEVLAAGQFQPRGATGGLFAGGFLGSEAGGVLGEAGDLAGFGVGMIAGRHAAGAARGLPTNMLVGVTATMVYGFAARSRRSEPTAMVFKVAREGLNVKVHQRVNVRVLELIHDDTGSSIELEGNRIPVTHSKDVIGVLTG